MSFIYLDTSVALAHLLAEDRIPSEQLWSRALIASRLLEYEIWNRIHARKLERTHGDAAREMIGRIAIVELVSPILDRARESFSVGVRTLDALHLSSLLFLIENGQSVTLASYDEKMTQAARSLKIPIYKHL
jgi:hypothetical protein